MIPFLPPRTAVIFLALLSFNASALASTAAAADQDLARNPEVAAAVAVLDAWIDRTTRDREQPGLSVGIVCDQQLIWAKGYGYANLARKIPATPTTAYRIASLSKLFTATALLQLRDAGKLQLDDPVEKYLPWFRFKNERKDSPVITIRHLLTHTSGIPRELTGTYWNDMKFPTREELTRMLPQEETILPTETEWKYSNVALSIAGYVVEKASGEAYAQYIQRQILRPLGMTGTSVLPTTDMPTLAVGYGRRLPGKGRRIEPFLDSAYMVPAANLASTVEDLARFAELQFRDGPAGGTQILKGSTLKEMQRIHWLQPDWKSGWGLGWGVRRVTDQVRISHGGSVPGYRTQITLAPAEKFGVIVLTNAEDGEPGRYVNQAFTIVGPAVAKATARTEATVTADSSWSKYVGTYEWEDDEVQVMLLNGELAIVNPRDDNPWEERVKLEPVAPHVFRMKGGGQSGELIRFETDAAGNVTRMVEAGDYMVRVRDKS